MKKLLSTFIIWCIWLISFCSSTYYWTVSVLSDWTLRVPTWYSTVSYTIEAWHFLYFHWEFGSRMSCSISWTNISLSSTSVWVIAINTWINSTVMELSCNNTFTSHKDLQRIDFDISSIYNCPTCQVCQECEECQECNECPIIDIQYCQENNLCPSSWTWWDCPIYTWDWNWSALLINDEQYNSAWIINVSIPSDYWFDYVNDWDQVDLTVEWYNVDTDYIEWIISNQTTKPNQTDLNNIITWVIPLFVPWLVIILFIYFIFKFLKKIF